MGILDSLRSAVTAPLARTLASEVIASPWTDRDRLTQVTLDDLWGVTTLAAVSRKQALRISTVAKARTVLAPTIGRLPLYTVKGNVRTTVQPTLLGQPERTVALSTTLTKTVDALIFYPCTWWRVTERDTYGWPLWVEWIDRSRATVDVDGNLTHIDGTAIVPANIIRFDSPLGAGLLDIARDTLNRAVTINRTAANAEENPVPSIDLHSTDPKANLTPDEIAELVKQWREARIKGSVAYTPASVEAKPLGVQPEQLLISARKEIKTDLAQHLGVPAWVLDVELNGSAITYQNRQALNAELIDLALSPYMTAIVDRLSLGDVTPRGWRVLFDTDALTKPDMQTRFTTYKIGIDGGFYTPEQIAEAEGWNTTTGGTP